MGKTNKVKIRHNSVFKSNSIKKLKSPLSILYMQWQSQLTRLMYYVSSNFYWTHRGTLISETYLHLPNLQRDCLSLCSLDWGRSRDFFLQQIMPFQLQAQPLIRLAVSTFSFWKRTWNAPLWTQFLYYENHMRGGELMYRHSIQQLQLSSPPAVGTNRQTREWAIWDIHPSNGLELLITTLTWMQFLEKIQDRMAQ